MYGKKFYAKGQNLNLLLTKAYDAALEKYDVLIMPTLPYKAKKLPLEGSATKGDICGDFCLWFMILIVVCTYFVLIATQGSSMLCEAHTFLSCKVIFVCYLLVANSLCYGQQLIHRTTKPSVINVTSWLLRLSDEVTGHWVLSTAWLIALLLCSKII